MAAAAVGDGGGRAAGDADAAWRALGTVVRVKTTYGDEFTGSVFAIDDAAGMVVFKEELEFTTLKRNVRIVKGSAVDSVEVVEAAPGRVEALPPLSMEAIRAREKHAMDKVRRDLKRVGRGVTPFAQALMNELGKTYEVAWEGKTIALPHIGIRVSEPYGAAECTGDDQTALLRIRRIVEAAAPKLERSVSDESGGDGRR
mmetsp:Transcript_25290/g.88243  ORF Transcript_25290/g.88243 Transcript_25290/m.88243 type:complete len:200 (-) Transcript_25290:95-694(-)